MRSAPDAEPPPRDARLPAWRVALVPVGPGGVWWSMVVEGRTQTSSHPSVSWDDDVPGGEPTTRRRTTTTYTLRTVARAEAPAPGSGAAGVRRGPRCEVSLGYAVEEPPEDSPPAPALPNDASNASWRLDGSPLEVAVRERSGTDGPSWRAEGRTALPVTAGIALVDLEVVAHELDDVLDRWTLVPVGTLMNRRAAWLADLSSRS